jgi:rubrerythrin
MSDDERDEGRPATPSLDDPSYRAALVDLLGVLAYGELMAFERLAEDAKLAPTLDDKSALAAMAAAEFGHHARLKERIAELGSDPNEAMRPFVTAVDAFHTYTAPADWLEGLVKAYVGDSLAADFYREVASHLDPETARLIDEVMQDTGHGQFAVDKVRAAIAEDPRVGGRLALWGRRIMGEALSQAQRVAVDRDALSSLLAGGVSGVGFDLSEVGKLFTRLAEAHSRRMSALGLSA